MALRAATLAALLAAGSLPPAPSAPARASERITAQLMTPAAPAGNVPPSALPDQPVPPFTPVAPAPAPAETWIFSGLLDDGRQPYAGTLVRGSDATAFALEVGAGVSCAGGTVTTGVNATRVTDVPCSDDGTLWASFIIRGGAELTVFGQVGARRFTAIAHRLGTEGPPDAAGPAPAKARDAAPPVPPHTAPAPSRPRNG